MKHIKTDDSCRPASSPPQPRIPALAIDISGAGATFPYPIYAKWADAYKKETGNGLNYQSIGSGGGIKQITAKTVTFGASDMPLKAEQLEKDGLVQFPTVLGGVVPVINVEGIKAGDITLDGDDARRDLPRQDQDLERSGDPEAQRLASSCRRSRSSSCIARTARAPPSCSPTTCRRSARTGSPRSAPTPRSNGRSASAPRATKASPTTSARPRARSATSSTPTPSRTS